MNRCDILWDKKVAFLVECNDRKHFFDVWYWGYNVVIDIRKQDALITFIKWDRKIRIS